ncbi:hypothetical protein ONS95_011002 [Cadophora gregata]|uniref:uncharacterized protein n=1 Tax=Cadophora gregata TaxID=51156 RepID=UPI0026DC247A|nr:uncharacterized protein ONS95_011002 [Cadophora gregata]KAK0119562.1 hypothetical protein ONS95_011002 [Cadophora gregata]
MTKPKKELPPNKPNEQQSCFGRIKMYYKHIAHNDASLQDRRPLIVDLVMSNFALMLIINVQLLFWKFIASVILLCRNTVVSGFFLLLTTISHTNDIQESLRFRHFGRLSTWEVPS